MTVPEGSRKPWKGFQALEKPNDYRCKYCNELNADWTTIELSIPIYVHKLCFFKSSHYGMTPAEHSRWRRDYMKARSLVLERDNYTCQMCKNKCDLCIRDLEKKGKVNLQVHHIVPVIKGGTNDKSNLLTLCAFCNQIADSVYRGSGTSKFFESRFPEYIQELKKAIDKVKLL